MGWNISHGTNRYGQVRRSYTTIGNLARQLAHTLPAADWRTISYLFNRPTGEPFTVSADDAGVAADVLRLAADHYLMPADWAAEAREIADAADRAASSGDSWKWS
jgi:hypothetical protein